MGALQWAPSKPDSGTSTRRRLARVPELPAVRHPAPYQCKRYGEQTMRRRDRVWLAYENQTTQTRPDRAPPGNSDDRTTALRLACG
jgi:5-methylcytosine-specific restriction endonuclease McrA